MNGLREVYAWAVGLVTGIGAFLADINWLAIFGAMATVMAALDRGHAMWSRHKRNRVTGD